MTSNTETPTVNGEPEDLARRQHINGRQVDSRADLKPSETETQAAVERVREAVEKRLAGAKAAAKRRSVGAAEYETELASETEFATVSGLPLPDLLALLQHIERLESAAWAVIDRWETPHWKDAAPTAETINALRSALQPREA